jgi:hypothetical protein
VLLAELRAVLGGAVGEETMKKPLFEEVSEYCQMRHSSVDPVAFYLHYETNGWMVGRVPMKNWKAGIANWDRMQQTRNGGNQYAKVVPSKQLAQADRNETAIDRAFGGRTTQTGTNPVRGDIPRRDDYREGRVLEQATLQLSAGGSDLGIRELDRQRRLLPKT